MNAGKFNFGSRTSVSKRSFELRTYIENDNTRHKNVRLGVKTKWGPHEMQLNDSFRGDTMTDTNIVDRCKLHDSLTKLSLKKKKTSSTWEFLNFGLTILQRSFFMVLYILFFKIKTHGYSFPD